MLIARFVPGIKTVADGTPPTAYDATFYQSLEQGTRRSAEQVVPILIEWFRPQSVVDVGCGAGLWLAAFRKNGVEDVLGVDGPWVGAEAREIPDESFLAHDLTQPLRLDRRFDLALCLEVAEHLPTDAAGALIESLTRLAPIVVFSAAIPGQGGEGHCNEQWPSFWTDRFAAFGFQPLIDPRGRIWTDDDVDVWYRQNMLCFAAEDIRPPRDDSGPAPLDIVHPRLFRRFGRELEQRGQYVDKLEDRVRQLVDERNRAQSELAAIKGSRAWPLFRLVNRGFGAMRRLLEFVGLR